jgi:hypothetical protein
MMVSNHDWALNAVKATTDVIYRYLNGKPLNRTERQFVAMLLLRVGSLPEGYKPIVRKEDETNGSDTSEAPTV